MKKIISFLSVLSIMLLSLSFTAFAEGAPVITVNDASGQVGDTVEVKIDISGNPGITALQLDVVYSSDDLELVAINDGELFNDSISHSPLSESEPVISWYAKDSSDSDKNGTLAVLSFKIKEGASDSSVGVVYNSADVFNSKFTDIHFDTADGKVSVSEGYLLGDVNNDGKIDVTDATLVQMIAAEVVVPTEAQKAAGDVNKDGSVDVSDATLIQMYAAETITHF